MQVLPVFGRVAAERVVEVLPFSQVPLDFIILLLGSILIVIEEKVAVIAVEAIKE